MKTIKILIIQMMVMTLISLGSCDLTCFPYSDFADEERGESLPDFKLLTSGAYAQTLWSEAFRARYFMGEYTADNVALSGNSGDNFRYSYQYEHIKNSTITRDMWDNGYKVIYITNEVINRISDDQDWEYLQEKAECLFIRAEQHFGLLGVFGLPYQRDNPATNLGIPLMDKVDRGYPARNTVKEGYDFVINDLLHAITLFEKVLAAGGSSKNCCYASKEVCEAFLARIYLYKDDLDNALLYANKVINSGRYEMVSGEDHLRAPTLVPENIKENIYAFRHTRMEDRDRDAIGSMYLEKDGSGWAEVYASQSYYDLVRKYPEDIRNGFIEPQYEAGSTTTVRTRNGVPRYYVNKFSYQEGYVNLSSPVFLRLAEMYMIRAEVYAKTGSEQEAIDIVNMIRQRAGLSGTALYTLSDLKGHENVMDVLLEERRLEFAFESHRKWDIFRNRRNLVRAYPGYHPKGDLGGTGNNFDMLILFTNPALAHFLPQREIEINKNLIDN